MFLFRKKEQINDPVYKKVLNDDYPEHTRTVFILDLLWKRGIVAGIREKRSLSERDIVEYSKTIEKEYGIARIYTEECIRIWEKAYSMEVTPVTMPCETEAKGQARASDPTDESCTDKNDADKEKDFLYEIYNGYAIINSYAAFDKSVVEVPAQIGGARVRIIGQGAFENCTGIKKIIIPEGVFDILDAAFAGCTSLREIVLPKSLQKLGGGAPKQKRHHWSTHTETGVFYNTALTSITLPENITNLGDYAFEECRYLSSITLPASLQKLPKGCFLKCKKLSGVILPDGLEMIDEAAFAYSGIETIDVPGSVEIVAEHAFFVCEKLKKAYFREGMKRIEHGAFYKCDKLETLFFPRSLSYCAKEVFHAYPHKCEAVVYCYPGSYGLQYARQEHLNIADAQTFEG